MGANLRQMRKDAGLSQEKLCAELQRRGCDIGRTTYEKYETGDLNIRISVLVDFRDLGVFLTAYWMVWGWPRRPGLGGGAGKQMAAIEKTLLSPSVMAPPPGPLSPALNGPWPGRQGLRFAVILKRKDVQGLYDRSTNSIDWEVFGGFVRSQPATNLPFA